MTKKAGPGRSNLSGPFFVFTGGPARYPTPPAHLAYLQTAAKRKIIPTMLPTHTLFIEK